MHHLEIQLLSFFKELLSQSVLNCWLGKEALHFTLCFYWDSVIAGCLLSYHICAPSLEGWVPTNPAFLTNLAGPWQQCGLCICVCTIKMLYYEISTTDRLIFLHFSLKVCEVCSRCILNMKKLGNKTRLEYLCNNIPLPSVVSHVPTAKCIKMNKKSNTEVKQSTDILLLG